MKRARSSTVSNEGRNEAGEVSYILINYSGPSFSNLPRDIMVNILLRLSIKRIFVCKSVCKTWYDLISDPEFAKFHFDQAQVYPLIQTSGFTFFSRMVYLVQPEKEDFELKLGMCGHAHTKSKCVCHVNVKLDTKFKLPLRNFQMVLDDKDRANEMLGPDSGGRTNECINLKMKKHKYRIVNSCNGLLCLSNPSDNDPLIVCNPVTGEFINLPEAKKVNLRGRTMKCGFGFSPVTNQYKVIRMFRHWTRDTMRYRYIDCGLVAEVHVLGTESWKEIGYSPARSCELFPAYLNGILYWASPYHPLSVLSFDIEKESFGLASGPQVNHSKPYGTARMGVLGGELCISFFFISGAIRVWVLKDYGVTKEWSEVCYLHFFSDNRLCFGPYQPIKYLDDGALLMFCTAKNALIYKHPGKLGFKYLKIHGMGSQAVEAIAHIPSFVSLKDALSGHNVKVLNVKARCAELKLWNEDKAVSIVENE